jgi:hypothetical protein
MHDPESTLAAYRGIVVVNHERLALELSLKFNKKPRSEQREFFGGTPLAGYVYLFRDEVISADTVMETVVSQSGDAITSLYKNHSVNAELGLWVRAREDLVKNLARKIGLSPGLVGIDDPGRGRQVGLTELSTGQLIDLLAEKMGTTILRSDSHAAGNGGILVAGKDGSLSVEGA